MRKTVAAFLITGLLSASAPMMARDRGGRDSGPDPSPIVRIIKSIIRHLVPAPADDSNNITPPKP